MDDLGLSHMSSNTATQANTYPFKSLNPLLQVSQSTYPMLSAKNDKFFVSSEKAMSSSSSSSINIDRDTKGLEAIVLLPKSLANALSEFEQQQKLSSLIRNEDQIQQQIFFSMQKQQLNLEKIHRQQVARSNIIRQLLEENNTLLASYFEYIRSGIKLPSFKIVLDQIKRNLNIVSQYLGTNDSTANIDDTLSTIPSLMVDHSHQTNSFLSSSSSFSHLKNSDSPKSVLNLHDLNEKTLMAALLSASGNNNNNSNIHSGSSTPATSSPIVSAAAAISSLSGQSKCNSLPSLMIPSSNNSSTTESPVSSPSIRAFNSHTSRKYEGIDSSAIAKHLLEFAKLPKNPLFHQQQQQSDFNVNKKIETTNHSGNGLGIGESLLSTNQRGGASPVKSSMVGSQSVSISDVVATMNKMVKESEDSPSSGSVLISDDDADDGVSSPSTSNSTEEDEDAEGAERDINNNNSNNNLNKVASKKRAKDDEAYTDEGSVEVPQKRRRDKRETLLNKRRLTVPQVLDEIEGLPIPFIESSHRFTVGEMKHWRVIKTYIKKAGKNAEQLPEQDKWRAWVGITSELPLNNGGPIRRVLEIAIFCAERSSGNPEIVKTLKRALSPEIYKVNAAGGCRKVALDMLQQF